MNLTPSQFGYIRIGFGTDLHRLTPGDGVWLGGIHIPCGVTAKAVSDGDVLLHALVDALLGAAALGDIGEHYPESRVEPGEPSSRFVTETLVLVRSYGLSLINVDCIVDMDVVHLGETKKDIRRRIAALLELDVSRVNVKAKTAEGLGPVGEGKAVSAQVVVLAEMSSGEKGL